VTDTEQVTAPLDDFVTALGRLDFTALGRTLAGQVRFRALVPPGIREADGRDATVALIASWFGDATEGTIVRRDAGTVGDRVWAAYRIGLLDEGSPLVAEQRALATLEAGKIATLDFMCSGFHPDEASST
jgi:hypothetical protein